MTVFDQSARFLAESMLNSLAEGVAIALFTWMVLRVSGRRSSTTRFAVWFSALIAIAALPWLHGFAANTSSVRPATQVSAFTLPSSWVTGVFLGWAVIASAGVLRVILGLRQLRQMRTASTVVDPSTLDLRLQRTLEEFSSRTVTLAISETLQVPSAIGFFQPRIVLPAWSMRELSAEELNTILIHELAHLRRWDDWTNLAQKLLRALFFFQPAIWWVESRVSLEREMACDDFVLSKSVSPRSYAECLVAVAEKSFRRRGLAMAQAAVSRMRHTTQRITQILDRNRSSATGVWKPALGLVTVFSAVCLVVLSKAPQIVAFQDAVPYVATATSSAAMVSVPVIEAKWSEPVARPISLDSRPHRKAASSAKATQPRHHSAPADFDANAFDAWLVQPPSIEALLPVTQTELRQSDDVTVQTVFVVVQAAGQDNPSLGWTLCVWRVTVRNSGSHAPIQTAIPAKSI